MSDGPISQNKHLGIGILGAASIARKNVRAIGLTTNGVGEPLIMMIKHREWPDCDRLSHMYRTQSDHLWGK